MDLHSHKLENDTMSMFFRDLYMRSVCHKVQNCPLPCFQWQFRYFSINPWASQLALTDKTQRTSLPFPPPPSLSLSLSLFQRNTMWMTFRLLLLLICATCHTALSFTNGIFLYELLSLYVFSDPCFNIYSLPLFRDPNLLPSIF